MPLLKYFSNKMQRYDPGWLEDNQISKLIINEVC